VLLVFFYSDERFILDSSNQRQMNEFRKFESHPIDDACANDMQNRGRESEMQRDSCRRIVRAKSRSSRRDEDRRARNLDDGK